MSVSPPRASRYQHVVFADALWNCGRVLDFGFRPRQQSQMCSISVPAMQHKSSQEADPFVTWILSEAGIDSSQYRAETLNRRLIACLRALRVNRTSQAQSLIEKNPGLLPATVSALVIGVTSFFRDSQVFDYLKTNVLPRLLASRKTLRIWSVGCSEGAELYSIAMLLDEMGALHRCELLGTDCRSDAIRQAQSGVYAELMLAGLSRDRLRNYFEVDKQTYQVAVSLRSQICWRTANVLDVREPGRWDMILCRNMAMYLEASAQEQLWNHLKESLHPGGILVLGKAERPTKGEPFSAIAPCIFRRDNG